jgi:hypothetical protein
VKPNPPGLRILTLRLTAGWWNQIREGSKTEELRLASPFYLRMLVGREYDEVHLWLGYPPKTDTSKLMRFRWRGPVRHLHMQHPHFGPAPVNLLGIDLTHPIEIPTSPEQLLPLTPSPMPNVHGHSPSGRS